MWTMRKGNVDEDHFLSDTASTIERDNQSNAGREALANNSFHHSKVDLPDE